MNPLMFSESFLALTTICSKNCMNCNTELRLGARFCRECGLQQFATADHNKQAAVTPDSSFKYEIYIPSLIKLTVILINYVSSGFALSADRGIKCQRRFASVALKYSPILTNVL